MKCNISQDVGPSARGDIAHIALLPVGIAKEHGTKRFGAELVLRESMNMDIACTAENPQGEREEGSRGPKKSPRDPTMESRGG